LVLLDFCLIGNSIDLGPTQTRTYFVPIPSKKEHKNKVNGSPRRAPGLPIRYRASTDLLIVKNALSDKMELVRFCHFQRRGGESEWPE
jgi:hypothetical protein